MLSVSTGQLNGRLSFLDIILRNVVVADSLTPVATLNVSDQSLNPNYPQTG